MKKILSYVLFGSEGRYWGNVQYLLIANSAIYPDFHMRFYVHKESMPLPGFQVLLKMKEMFPNVEIEIITTPYQGTQLTNWRMKPLWEDDVEILLCRDLDYIINALERKSVQHFLNHPEHLIHVIRSYHLHTTPYMAGLVGFRCQPIKNIIRRAVPSFERYLEWGRTNVSYCKDWRWGCDQALLRDFFGRLGLYPRTMDCPQYTAPTSIAEFNPTVVLPEAYQTIDMPGCNLEALAYSESISPGFTGAPAVATTDQVQALSKIVNNVMSKAVDPYV